MILLKGQLRNGIYILEGNTAISTTNVAETDEITLWHMRLGHMSEKGLVEPNQQKLLDIKKLKELKFYENCTLGKSKRIKFSQAVHTTKENLSYIHDDLWGPSRVELMGGARYFLSLIDDKSRKV